MTREEAIGQQIKAAIERVVARYKHRLHTKTTRLAILGEINHELQPIFAIASDYKMPRLYALVDRARGERLNIVDEASLREMIADGSIAEWEGDDAADEIIALSGGDDRARLITALGPLVAIANAYDDNGLDGEARKTWGKDDEHHLTRVPESIELFTGRGGRRLLTLADCLNARAAVRAATGKT